MPNQINQNKSFYINITWVSVCHVVMCFPCATLPLPLPSTNHLSSIKNSFFFFFFSFLHQINNLFGQTDERGRAFGKKLDRLKLYSTKKRDKNVHFHFLVLKGPPEMGQQQSKLAFDSYAAPRRSMLTKETGLAHPVSHYEIVGLGSIMGIGPIGPFNWSNASERSISALYFCVNT